MEKPFFGNRSRADALKEKSPQLIADVFPYATQDGGKNSTGMGLSVLALEIERHSVP